MNRRRGLVVIVVAAAAVAIMLPVAWWATRPSEAAGSLARYRSDRVAKPSPSVVAAGVGTRSGRLEDAPIGATRPVGIRVDAIGVDAPVVAVGLEPDGEMEIPASVASVGWYRPGVVPGRPGSAVLAGHVDSRSQGRGAFFDLRLLEPGATITIVDSRGVEHGFDVVARRQFSKQQLPADLFAAGGDARLALITCGGEFDSVARSYRDNVVVYAVAA